MSEQLQNAIARLKTAGGALANLAFNLAQRQGEVISERHAATLGECRKEWDVARSELNDALAAQAARVTDTVVHIVDDMDAGMRGQAARVEQAESNDWRIDTSAGRPILAYKGCSVIEAEQAELVLRLLASQPASAPDDCKIADTVNAVRDVAMQYAGTQQLRARIAEVLVPVLRGASAPDAAPVMWTAVTADGKPEFGKGWVVSPVQVAGTPMPLYAGAQPPAQELTDAEIECLLRALRGGPPSGDLGTVYAKLGAILAARGSKPC
jgi:hypothetical protein